jgi:2-aminobenzoate-CoA ligase
MTMSDLYPSSTIPTDYLVPPDLQPDYLELAGVDLSDHFNVAEFLVDAHVRAGRANAVAAIDATSSRSYTFGELARYSDHVAHQLLDWGLHPGDRVAYRSLNVPEVLIAALGAWKAGGVVVPIPAQAREPEIRFYLEDTEPRVLFVQDDERLVSESVGAASGTTVQLLAAIGEATTQPLIGLWPDPETRGTPPAPLPPVAADALALIWHTGGTTGRPKACYHTHRRFILGGLAVGRATGVQPGERWAAAAPIGHALGVIVHTIHTLLHGASVVFIDQLHRPDRILEAISSHHIHTFAAITATWGRMLEVLAERPQLDVSSISRAYAMWQSASSTAIRDAWRDRGVELLNNFGSTAFATWVLVPRADECSGSSLGRATDGYIVEAVDPADLEAGTIRPVPAGEIGRMVIKGPTGLTYWRRPNLQARDVVDGWTIADDLIRFDESGNASYLGRTDFLISTAGYKVAPGEVEAVLTDHPAVREAAVVGAPDPLRVEIVMAFVALDESAEASDELARELQQLVKQRLAPYKYPRRIQFIDALPRDPVGKVQQGLLKKRAADIEAEAPA